MAREPARRRRIGILLTAGFVVCAVLVLAQRMFPTPPGAQPDDAQPSLYINTYVPGESYTNTVLYFGAKHSVNAARATAYREVRTPDAILREIETTAAQAGAPLRRLTIAAHGFPGGIILDRENGPAPDDARLLTADLLVAWMDERVRNAIAPDATIVFESCDVQPIVGDTPAAEAEAFRYAVSGALGVSPARVVLFRGPAKYAWGFDGWVPRTSVIELAFYKREAAT